jgi:16S rRNA (guanine966-N2)-methyltransferase
MPREVEARKGKKRTPRRMRIVSGKFRGRNLKAPSSNAIRPTSDRLRESIFNILVHAYADPITDARVLDLFAGTGALGLESLSRGAEYALFVEEAAEARALIRTNVEALALTGATRIFRCDAARLSDMGPMEPFDLVFCDPPYGQGLAEKSLIAARDGKWLAPSALVVVEEAVKAGFKTPEGFDELERRTYDDTEIVIMRAP